MHSAVVLFALLTSQRAAASFYQCSVPIADTSKCSDTILDAAIAPGFCAVQFRDNIMMPRGLEVTPEGDVLVLERVSKDLSSAKIVKLYDTDGDNVAESKIDLVSMQGLNHGLAYRNGHIYASSSATVFRWPFTPASLEPITTSAEIVVHSMNADGQVSTPCVIFHFSPHLVQSKTTTLTRGCGAFLTLFPSSIREAHLWDIQRGH